MCSIFSSFTENHKIIAELTQKNMIYVEILFADNVRCPFITLFIVVEK